MQQQNLRNMIGQIVEVCIDRPLGTTGKENNVLYLCNYGYVPQTTAGDGEPIDAYVLGVTTPLPLNGLYLFKVVGAIIRHNDVEDKLIVAPCWKFYTAETMDYLVRFAEQRYDYTVYDSKE